MELGRLEELGRGGARQHAWKDCKECTERTQRAATLEGARLSKMAAMGEPAVVSTAGLKRQRKRQKESKQ